MDPFKDVIPAILQNGKEVITEENETAYNPFLTNKALSFHYDCILRANQMNAVPNTDKLLQFHYLLYRIRKYRRPYQKWYKKETEENLEAIQEYYKYSRERAKEVLTVLSTAQIEKIKKKIGGNNDPITRANRGNP